MTIAQTILAQLGGNRFVAMTGAKNLVNTGNGLSFKIGRNASSINRVTVELKDDDTYLMMFQRLRGVDLKTVAEHDGVYVDQLREMFTSATGMACTL